MKMITWIKRLVITFSFLALIVMNMLTLTHSAFNAALSGLFATALGVQTVTDVLRSQLEKKDKTIKKQNADASKHRKTALKRKTAVRKFGTRLTSRTKRVALKSIAAIPAESIPLLGISVLIADTSYELFEACNSVKDLDQLYRDLGIVEEIEGDAMHTVCNPSMPDAGEIWGDVVSKSSDWMAEVLDSV